ncbi:MAG: hypothetical protein WCF85_08835 [Rhodospirillaceae bacterium]
MYEVQTVSDIDSLFRLPLESLASLFQSPSLPKNVLTKERILDPSHGAAVEFFRSKKSGGGLRTITDTIKELNLCERDRAILSAFASLPSYDPFSLRTALRETLYRLNEQFQAQGIVLTMPDNLPIFQLSNEMQVRLSEYTRLFTKPLVHLLLKGDSDAPDDGVETPADLIAIVTRAREGHDHKTLGKLKENLLKVGHIVGTSDLKKIEVELSIYGDAMLSLGYLKRYYFEVFAFPFQKFIGELVDMEKNKRLNTEIHGLHVILKKLGRHLKESMSTVELVLSDSDDKISSIWRTMNPDEFKTTKEMLLKTHDHIAGILCGWGSRVGSWDAQIEANRLMSPNNKADFLMHYIYPGIDNLPSPKILLDFVNVSR